MARGYWIASLDVSDAEAYKKYVEANAVAFAKYGARFLTRRGPFIQLEGKQRARNVILEFKDMDTALSCYHSPEYQSAKLLRDPISSGDIIIMAGYDGPQPPNLPGDAASVFKS